MKTIKITKKAFIAFCKSKPPEETYSYLSTRNCPFAQFLKQLGYPNVIVGGWTYGLEVYSDTDLPSWFLRRAGIVNNPSQTWKNLITSLNRPKHLTH